MPQRLGQLTNIPLPGQKHQSIPPRPELPPLDVIEHRHDLLAHALVAIFRIPQILHRYRVSTAAHLDNGRVVKVRRETRHIDSRRGHDHLQIGSAR